MRNNAKTVQDDDGAIKVEIAIVACDPGTGMLKLDSPTASRVADRMKANVRAVACKNTMRAQKITKDDMLPVNSYLPAGVTEIMKKQGEGWAYLRP